MGGLFQGPRNQRSSAIWLAEFASVVGSIACLAALLILVGVYNGRPIFDWHGVTLNAVVSVLSTASRACILLVVEESISQWKWILFWRDRRQLLDFERLDEASRGPWGSLKILWTGRRSGLVFLGAIAILIALTIDPFAQQLVQIEHRVNFSNSTEAHIVRAQQYSKGLLLPIALVPITEGSPPAVVGDSDFSMQSAILYGLTNPLDTVVQQVPFKCPSSNCTFPAFESISVCSKCNDITSQLERHRDNGALAAVLERDNGAAVAGNGTAFILPNGAYIDNMDGWIYGTPLRVSLTAAVALMTSYGTGNATQTNSMKDVDTLIWSETFIKVPRPDAAHNVSWPEIPLQATECALYYCVNTYHSVVVNGTLQENVTRYDNAKRDPKSFLPTSERWAGMLNSSQLTSLEFDDVFSAIDRSDLSFGQGFNISQSAVHSISSYFRDNFKAQFVNKSDYEQILNEQNLTGRVNGWHIDSGNEQWGPSVMQAFYASENLSSTFESLAWSMSNALRAGDTQGSQQSGEVGSITTYYRIRWPWIVPHCIVVILALVFMMGTIFTTRSTGAPVLKSSALAAMQRGSHINNALDGADSVGQLKAKAEGSQVNIFQYEGSGSGYHESDVQLNDWHDGHKTGTVHGTHIS